MLRLATAAIPYLVAVSQGLGTSNPIGPICLALWPLMKPLSVPPDWWPSLGTVQYIFKMFCSISGSFDLALDISSFPALTRYKPLFAQA